VQQSQRERGSIRQQAGQQTATHLVMVGDGVTRHVTVGFSDPAVRSFRPERDQAAQRQRRRKIRWMADLKNLFARKPPSVGGSPRLQPNWWSSKNCLRWPPVWRPWPSRTTRTWPEIGIGSGRALAGRVQQSGMSLVNLYYSLQLMDRGYVGHEFGGFRTRRCGLFGLAR
jgi:hypothetical protein